MHRALSLPRMTMVLTFLTLFPCAGLFVPLSPRPVAAHTTLAPVKLVSDQSGAAMASVEEGQASAPTSAQPVGDAPEAMATITAFPNRVTLVAGVLSRGGVASLVRDDNAFLVVHSTTTASHTADWYGSFTGVSRNLSNLKVHYKGKNSQNCPQTLSIFRWTTHVWVPLDARPVGITEVAIYNLVPTGALTDYVSGTTSSGEVRVRIRCQASSNLTNSGEMMSIVYNAPVVANTPPTLSSIAPQTINEDGVTGTLAFTVGDAETAAVHLTVSGSTSNPTLVPVANIVLGGSGASRTVTVTPVANQSGQATITVTVYDGQASTPTSFLLTVTAVNDAPTLSSIAPQTIYENTATGALAFTVRDEETAAESLTVSGSTANPTLVPPGNMVFGGIGTIRTVTVTPAANQRGTALLTVTVSDGQASRATSFLLTVTAVPVGLVAAYSFNEEAGTTLNDLSGNNNVGTIVGATWTTAGKYGGALMFNGTDARVSVPAAASLNLSTGMTLSAWVQPTAVQSGWHAIVQREVDAYLLHASSNGTLVPAGGGTFGGGVALVSGSTAIAVNEWTHLALTYNGAMLQLYVNGAVVASQAQTGSLEANGNPLWIGGNSPYGEYFQGLIDEMRLYNRALSPAELQSDRETPLGGTAAPVLDILRPLPNQQFLSTSVVNVTYTARGHLTGVDHVHFQLDSNSQVMDRTFEGVYQFTNVPAGTHVLKGYLVRVDHSKIVGSDDTVSFSTTLHDVSPPTVAMTAPLAGATLSGVATLTATASDDTGIAGVQFRLDGTNIGALDTVAPYTLPFHTATVANGPHTITAVARDLGNNVTSSQAVAVVLSNTNPTDPATIGRWAGPYAWPFVAIHLTLLPTGDVVGWDDHTEAQGMYLWHPSTGLFTTFPHSPSNLFCSGHTGLPTGQVLIAGGTGTTFNIGIPDAAVYNPATQTFTAVASMTYARYYPTLISLPDGNAVVFSGTDDCPSGTCIQDIPERYNRLANTWTALPGARLALPYYPHLFVLPDGRLLNTGATAEPLPTRVLNVATESWTILDTNVQSGGSTAMYRPWKVVRTGTAGDPNTTIQATAATQVLDLTQSTPQWRTTMPMAFPRIHHNVTLLPDGTVLATGGGRSSNANELALAVYEAELWSPATETWRTLAAMQTPRLYHGTALLLPDGRVLVAGSGRPTGLGADQFNAEMFSPPYLFKGPRPTIAAAPAQVLHGATFFVATSDAARVAKVAMVRLGSVTHAFDSDQRYLELVYQPRSGGLDVQAPANSNLALPGHYMLFLVDTNGVPSTAAMLQLPVPS